MVFERGKPIAAATNSNAKKPREPTARGNRAQANGAFYSAPMSWMRRMPPMLEAVFGSLRTGVVVLDNDLRVQIWNKGAERMWGLSEEEARGKEFMTLEIGITVSQLEPLIRARLEGTHEDGEQ